MIGELNLGSDWTITGNDTGTATIEHGPTNTTFTLQDDGTLKSGGVDAGQIDVDKVDSLVATMKRSIAAGETRTIPEGQSAVVAGPYTTEGTVSVDGVLKVI